jgi:hypothetical protein
MTTDIYIQEKEKVRDHTALIKAAVDYIVEGISAYNA